MAIAKFGLVALDCPDPRRLAEFYQQITGGELIEESDLNEWVSLKIPGATDIGFQLDPDYVAPGWPDGSPQQAHLDFDVEHLEAAEAAVLAIGARKTAVQPDPASFRVFLDPAGHPFCLVKV